MGSVLENKEKNVVQLTIDVEPEVFQDAMQKAFRKNANRFMIPGFRKGKAPMSLVTKYYGEGVLYEDAIDLAANPAYTAAIEEHSIEPVSQPEIDILDIGREKGLKFSVTVTVKPEVTLGDYKGVEAVKPEFPVEDQAVEEELKRIQERNSRMIPVEDRPVQEDDTVNIDYEGFMGDEAFEGGQGSDYDLKIGSKTFIPGFEKQLIGHETGESLTLTVNFPDDYNNDELAGKEATFKVKINSIKVRELPELDDEFAKDVSECDTLEAYKADLRKKLEEDAQKRTDAAFEENVIRAVTEKAQVDIPEVMVEQEVDRMVDEQRNQMLYQGFELEQYLKYMGQTLDQFKEHMADPARERVRTRLVLEAIAKAESVTASEEEVSEEVEKMAKMYNMPVDDLKKRIPEGEDNFVVDAVVHRKAVEMLVKNAVPVAPPPEEEKKENTNDQADNETDNENDSSEEPAEPSSERETQEEKKDAE
jgi:trigger factor